MYEVEYPDGHPYLECRWRAEVVEAGEYVDAAKESWGLAFTVDAAGRTRVDLAGPNPSARTLDGIVGDRHWGVEFHAHVVVAGLEKSDTVGLLVPLDIVDDAFELGGVRHRVPSWGALPAFVDALVAAGILTLDYEARRGIDGHRSGWSERAWQRRIKAATGLTGVRIAQFARARAAAEALLAGAAPADVAAELGYSDHAHLTRSLVELRGERPSELRRRRSP